MKSWHLSMAAVLSVALVSCGGGRTPSAPVLVATPTPAPTPTPTPAPTPTPDAGEPPVTNTNPPVRITARLYLVEDPSGRPFDYAIAKDGTPIVPLGFRFRVDIVAKDKKNKETSGTGHPEWTFDPEHLIDIETFSNEFQPRLRASRIGTFNVYATLDKIQSNTITVYLVAP
ncbi:MAG TPA: hypothetical protein VIK51_18525 [Vicinamibacteria bacterium]|jgi:hypothetical protein